MNKYKQEVIDLIENAKRGSNEVKEYLKKNLFKLKTVYVDSNDPYIKFNLELK